MAYTVRLKIHGLVTEDHSNSITTSRSTNKLRQDPGVMKFVFHLSLKLPEGMHHSLNLAILVLHDDPQA